MLAGLGTPQLSGIVKGSCLLPGPDGADKGGYLLEARGGILHELALTLTVRRSPLING